MIENKQLEKLPTKKLPLSNWVNQETSAFIASLSFNQYILAGNSITNMVQGIPLQGDLDFWASDRSAYLRAFEQISQHYDIFCIYPSMIQMFSEKGRLPKINLVFTNLTPIQTIQRFDFDYCRCYWVPNTEVVYGTGCQESIRTKVIKNIANQYRIMRKRILKAVKYGYIFYKHFWGIYEDLIANPRLKVLIGIQERRAQPIPFPVRIDDLEMNKFLLNKTKFKITDIKNISKTLEQLSNQFKKIAGKQDVKLPVLLKFRKNQKKFIKDYIKSIIFQNPLSDSHYLEIRIGTKFIYYGNRTRGNQQNSQIEESEESDSNDQNNSQQHKQPSQQEQQNQIPQQMNKNFPDIIICDDYQQRTIILNEDGSASIEIDFLPLDKMNQGYKYFDEMWGYRPEQKHKIIMNQKQYEVSRFSKSYMKTPNNLEHTKTRSYMYSGYDTSKNNEKIPYVFNPFYYHVVNQEFNYNQLIVNWYRNQYDYIAPHADCQRGMIKDAQVCIISFYPTNDPKKFRYMQIIPKNNTKALSQKLTIRLDHGMIIKMKGRTQDQFLHGIRKQNQPCLPRISLSFRQMSLE